MRDEEAAQNFLSTRRVPPRANRQEIFCAFLAGIDFGRENPNPQVVHSHRWIDLEPKTHAEKPLFRSL